MVRSKRVTMSYFKICSNNEKMTTVVALKSPVESSFSCSTDLFEKAINVSFMWRYKTN